MQHKPFCTFCAVIILFDRHMHLVSHFFALLTSLITVQDSTLLIAGFGTKLKLPMCDVCHMPCCFRIQQDYPLELSFQVCVCEPLRDQGCLRAHLCACKSWTAAEQMQQTTAAHMAEQSVLAVLAGASEGIEGGTCPNARNEDPSLYKELRLQQRCPTWTHRLRRHITGGVATYKCGHWSGVNVQCRHRFCRWTRDRWTQGLWKRQTQNQMQSEQMGRREKAYVN